MHEKPEGAKIFALQQGFCWAASALGQEYWGAQGRANRQGASPALNFSYNEGGLAARPPVDHPLAPEQVGSWRRVMHKVLDRRVLCGAA
jgi:hypothetical protein